MEPTESTPYLPPKIYDKVKFLVLILLPAFSTFYFTFGNIWGFPEVEKVIGSVTAAELFLGAVIGLSARNYNRSDAKYDGMAVVQMDAGGVKGVDMVLNGNPEVALEYGDEFRLKVVRP